MADMPGMDMGSMWDSQSAAGTVAHGCDESETPPAPCDTPLAPDACLSMAPCAPVALAAQHVSLPEISSRVLHVASLSVLQPPSETTAPELPPPRA